MKFFLTTCLGIVVVLLNGCYYDNEEELYPGSASSCDSANVTYTLTVEPVLKSNCYVCHSSAVADGGIILDTYTKLSEVVSNGKLVGVINHSSGYSPMPKNQAQLSSCNIQKITSWINRGALDN
jgi:uncharacterized membrane protein